ncbi:MAG TPA: adenylosuccinate lyase [Steroidobacteraceae bacterium]|jgi:adenylosuccinate lyase|nr:adenylosuccinate lyase [Steroidobacteraceae bacterium]
MDPAALLALSPIDGRYRRGADPLRAVLSESGLIRERVRIEAAWLLALAESVPQLLGQPLSDPVRQLAASLALEPGEDAAAAVKAIESRINHDVKAVEYYVREKLEANGASPAVLELVHFGCTSEDINNLAYARMLRAARAVLSGALEKLIERLRQFAHEHAALAMLSRTHGQTASPTTLGKEFANVVARLRRARARFDKVEILGKWNGAVGNYNAHVAALPQVDWPAVSRRFIESQGIAWNEYTTQIEPHDWIGEYCDALAGINTVLTDFARDTWGYISLGYLRQRAVAGEVGSSTMPHKVNPIDFENAEGNLGVANALLHHFAAKLPISRWQRDLTDSTVLRNVGVALAHSLIAWSALQRGLGKIAADPKTISIDIERAYEVLGEALQTALRAAGVPNGYELLKDFTRGAQVDAAGLATFIDKLPLPDTERARLKALAPQQYLGLAAQLARSI